MATLKETTVMEVPEILTIENNGFLRRGGSGLATDEHYMWSAVGTRKNLFASTSRVLDCATQSCSMDKVYGLY